MLAEKTKFPRLFEVNTVSTRKCARKARGDN